MAPQSSVFIDFGRGWGSPLCLGESVIKVAVDILGVTAVEDCESSLSRGILNGCWCQRGYLAIITAPWHVSHR